MSGWGKNYPDQSPKKPWSFEEAKEKLASYCAYQERCIWEVKKKMYEKGVKDEDKEELIAYLISEKFLDEERYAMAFARGKFLLKRWGKSRIARELKMRQIPQSLIQKGLSEIDPIDYYDTLLAETEKKWERTPEKDPFKKRFKVIGYLMGKGFEQDLIQEAIENLKT
ncbi:regulatory protein RecX [Algoriphagus sp. CAU 1675]|uniref:regulatory protein RecX n=1 Tax=Algoriphagus sp. CAU 1675 TaxID=3032597 RepID=UPI0023DC39A3|nr:regulatory protein RecX [Algoriphagus sp. CAU 1675]MDF2156666.1 regulatory protein RecX [Algoriphagus sp. CAU 1675]